MKFILGVLAGGFLFSICAHADNPASAVGISDAAYVKMGFIVYALNTVMTGVRNILAKYDGIDPTTVLPANAPSNLTFMNKVCVLLGKAMDFIMANPAH